MLEKASIFLFKIEEYKIKAMHQILHCVIMPSTTSIIKIRCALVLLLHMGPYSSNALCFWRNLIRNISCVKSEYYFKSYEH